VITISGITDHDPGTGDHDQRITLLMMTGATVLALAKGWGLEPVSYAWILGMQVGVPFVVQVLMHTVFEDAGCERCAAREGGSGAAKPPGDRSGSDDSEDEP
jgi:hypothetical protein